MIFLNEKNSTLVIPWLILLSLAFSDPFKDLDIDFLLQETNQIQPTKKSSVKKTKNKKSYDNIIAGFQEIEGLFNLYWDYIQNKAYLSIAKSNIISIFELWKSKLLYQYCL